MTATEQRVIDVIKKYGGIARTRDMLSSGVHSRILYRMRDEGIIECISRGLYKVSGHVLDEPDLATVFKKIPHGVACLISALTIHGITTEIPNAVYVSLQRGAEKPRIDYPPVRYFWMSGEAYREGVEIQVKDRVDVPVYCVEKTLADCFKYRNKIGLDVVLEALKLYRERYRFDGNKIMRYARICRVENVMRPYLEASL